MIIRKIINLFLFVFLAISFLLVSCSKDDVTSASETKQSLKTRLQAALDKARTDNNITGISAAVWTESNGDWTGVSGNSYGNVAVMSDMRFGMGSTSKNFTAALCLKLQEENKLNLDDPISTWLPSINKVKPNTTLRQLLNHQSGIASYTESAAFNEVVNGSNPAKVWTTSEILDMIGEPLFQPGKGLSYSNTNYILAGMILEKVSNKTYKDLLKEKILTPLGLENTYVEGFETVKGTIAHPHTNGNDIFSTSRIAFGTISWAAGCLVSTSGDLNKWWKAYSKDFLSEASKAQARNFQTQEGADVRYGIGLLEMDINGKKYEGHDGSTIGYDCFSYYSQDKKQIITVMANSTGAQSRKVAEALIEVLKSM